MKKALDLFCGAGGASMGIYLAGYEVTGVDISHQPNYPFNFIKADAVEYLEELLESRIIDYDFIWASPPCQAYTWSAKKHVNAGKEYPDLVDIIRELLIKTGKPYIIENVPGAPLNNPVVLCGTMFPDLKVFRHRLFESNFPLVVEMQCSHAGHKAMETRKSGGDFYTVAGHFVGTTEEWGNAMGIEWMKKKELTQAIPPDYAYYLVSQIK